MGLNFRILFVLSYMAVMGLFAYVVSVVALWEAAHKDGKLIFVLSGVLMALAILTAIFYALWERAANERDDVQDQVQSAKDELKEVKEQRSKAEDQRAALEKERTFVNYQLANAREEARRLREEARIFREEAEDFATQMVNHVDQARMGKEAIENQLAKQRPNLEPRRKSRDLRRKNWHLERCLQESLLRLVAWDPSHLDPNAVRPQHDQLLKAFHQLRNQEFRALAEAILAAAKVVSAQYGMAKPPALWQIQCVLADKIINGGSRTLIKKEILAVTKSPDEARTPQVETAVNTIAGLEKLLHYQLSLELKAHLEMVVESALTFIANLLRANPPGRLLFPIKDTPFASAYHEVWNGTAPGSFARIRRTIFPGYVVHDGHHDNVAEKAQVKLADA